MIIGPVGCWGVGPSDRAEHVETAKQADTFEPPPISSELPHIIPAGPGPATGYLPGRSSVSASGGYEYTIPLDVAPGRAGMQPSLALTYASGAGVDSLGVGWAVAGTRSIVRLCAPTFATNGHVGFPSQFCLDQQPLMPTGNPGEYRTEKDSFAQVKAQPAQATVPDSWVVRLKNGRNRTYKSVRYDGTNTRFWALEREVDRRGNTVRYYYDHRELWESCTAAQKADPVANPECKEPYTHFYFELERIEYTANEAEQARRKVVFHHQPRDPQVKPTYIRVWDVTKQSFHFQDVSNPLDLIEMYGPTEEPWSGTPSLAWSYELVHTSSPDTGRPLLVSVKKCSASQGCLLAREFTYGERSPGASDSYEVLWEMTRSDVVLAEDLRIFDGTGDGKDDIHIVRDADPDPLMVDLHGHLFPSGDSAVFATSTDTPADAVPVDIDGDGFVELVGTRTMSPPPNLLWENWVYKPQGSTGVLQPWVKLPDMPSLWPNDPHVTGYETIFWTDHYPILFGDLDGDGLPDLCRSRPGGTLPQPNYDIQRVWTCARNLGDGSFGPWGLWAHVTWFGDGQEYLADLDGDGRVEFYNGDAALGDRNGDGFQEVLASSASDTVTVGDFDGDGRDDLVNDASLTVDYAHPNPGAQAPNAHRTGSTFDVGTFRGDFDGNGRDDLLLVWIDANQATHMKAITMAGPDPDRLVEVGDEDADWRERVTYTRELAPNWDPTSCTGATYPNTCVRRGFSVVSRLESRTGTPHDRHFAYDFPTYDRHGRGFLGFNRVLEWQPDRPALLITQYDNIISSSQGVYPLAFRPLYTIEVVPILEPLSSGAAIPHLSSANARVKRTKYRYLLDKHWTGRYSVIPDPESSWNSEEWEQEVSIDWAAWPHIVAWWSLLSLDPAIAKRRQGIEQYDSFGNLTFSEERTLGGPHPTLGNIGGTRRTTTLTYDLRPADWLISLVDQVQVEAEAPDGLTTTRTTKYVHDAWGQLESIEHMPNSNADEQQLITYTRNTRGLITDVTATTGGAAARVQHIQYDDEGVHPKQTWNDYGHTSSMKVHPTLSVPTMKVDPNGVTDHWIYDDLGRLRHAIPQAGNWSTTQYEPWIESGLREGTLVKVFQEDGARSETWLDDQGRGVTSRSLDFAGQWRNVRVSRDRLGRVFYETRPYYVGGLAVSPATFYRFDSLDRVVEASLPDFTSRVSTYDFLQTVHHDALGNEQVLTYDFDDRVLRRASHALPTPSEPGSTLVSNIEYAPFGQIKTITDNGGNQIQMFYDHRGRPKKTIHPDRGQTIVQYNGHGEVQWSQTAAGTSTYTHDDLGRVTLLTTWEGNTELVWDQSPNGICKLSSSRSFDGTKTSYTYEPNGNIQDAIWNVNGMAGSLVLSRTYDDLGRLQTLEYPEVTGLGRTKIEYGYNEYGYLQRVADVSPTVAADVLWSVLARNQEDALLMAEGGDWATTMSYGPNNRIEEIKVVDTPAMTDVLHLNYHYDLNGSVDLREDLVEGRREVFRMDGHHRLKQWRLDYGLGGPNPGNRTSTYTYDDVDNLQEVSVSGSAISPYSELFTSGNGGKPHALYNNAQPNAPQSYFYDARGRLSNGDGRQYTYTSFDLPRTITTPAGTTSFEYDASGQRVKKWGPGGMTVSIGGLYESREESSGMSHVFVVQGSDGPIAQIVYRPSQQARKVHYLHQDALASVNVTTAQGIAASRSYYEPFGARVDVAGNPVAGPVQDIRNGFTGHRHDDDLGLINMRGRVYDPGTRRFLTPDPFAQLDENPYGYVGHDPLNWTDPSGFTPEKPGGSWYDGILGLFGGSGGVTATPIADYSGMAQSGLAGTITSAVMAVEVGKGNDGPNSSGCPTGTGSAPRPCAGAGQSGCPAGPEAGWLGITGRVLWGAGERLTELPLELAVGFLNLNAMRAGGLGMGSSAANIFQPGSGYVDHGWDAGRVLDEVNNLNPLYAVSIEVIKGIDAGEKGNYEAVGRAGMGVLATVVLVALTRKAVGKGGGPVAAEGTPLVHLTGAGSAISESGMLLGRNGIYVTTRATAGHTGAGMTLRTGVRPSSATSVVPIPSTALGAFRRPIPIGPMTAWQRGFGTQYSASGTLDLAAGTFARTGVNWNQVGFYAVDAAISVSVGTGAYIMWTE
ncbi:RHS repeat-associated core domain-containing protein [Polyangium mundeleinium]|uniref:SpvB/TcaC N-terminal domain-containing protein n=1 Tax=Polyangium mundeleinium TaxID=2995306 RepID=A0ABT5EYP4_9BACT|nr:RHS repeat-associated core domain-containing protein [Polyangium mundeleinium]MDC0746392.1 SpvB/TcaC N-terminal domain-containing protein [Polyangium mundeleinium]